MGNMLIKPDPNDKDFYVMWSSIVEAPVAFGTREEIRQFMIEEAIIEATEKTDRLLGLADATGTSSRYGLQDVEELIYEQKGMIKRGRLRELCERLANDALADMSDLLEPFSD